MIVISSYNERSSNGKHTDLGPTVESDTRIPRIPPGRASHSDSSLDRIHLLSAVYTKPDIVEKMLDQIGWHGDNNLSASRLLEPAAGNGQFIVAAARRLLSSYRRHGIPTTKRTLSESIAAFELHPQTASVARSRVIITLRECGVDQSTARACSSAWINQKDFLLAPPPTQLFTHVVGNPPYLRWSKVPSNLRLTYEKALTREIAKGDLLLPILDRTLEYLTSDGVCAILCSDRWQYMAYAQDFRNKWLPRLHIRSNSSIPSSDAFVRPVDAYPTILVAQKRSQPRDVTTNSTRPRGRTLKELSFIVRVGPALGAAGAFVLASDEQSIVEPQLQHPWVNSSEIQDGAVEWKGRRVITMFNENGELLDIRDFPKLEKHLSAYRSQLTSRRIVRDGAPWYRPIERVRARDWLGPKLLVPGLAKVPRLALDKSGLIPSHGVYAILPQEEANIEDLYEKLSNGGLAAALLGIAPKVKNDYVRCYRYFLQKIRL